MNTTLITLLSTSVIGFGLFVPSNAQAEAKSSTRNRVTVSGIMEILDDEVINRRNVRVTRDVSGTAIVGVDPSSPIRMEGCAGSEIRVELELDVQGVSNSNDVRVTGNAYLYEGTSCTSGDLEDTETIRLTVPANQYAPYTINLLNAETFGGDTASISLNFYNAVQN